MPDRTKTDTGNVTPPLERSTLTKDDYNAIAANMARHTNRQPWDMTHIQATADAVELEFEAQRDNHLATIKANGPYSDEEAEAVLCVLYERKGRRGG